MTRDFGELGEKLRQALAAQPDDTDAWLDLCRMTARTRRVPDWLVRDEHGPLLRQLWQLMPEERRVGDLLLPLLGLELVTGEDEAPGPFWEDEKRVGRADDHLFDLETGMPLQVRNPRTGAVLVWCPGGAYTRGADGPPPPDDEVGGALRAFDLGATGAAPPHEVEVTGFYLSRTAVTAGEWAAFVEATGRPPPPEWEAQRVEAGRAVLGIDWESADAFARWAGGRLPYEAEWEWAARSPDDLPLPWSRDPHSLDRTRAGFGDPEACLALDRWNARLQEAGWFTEGVAPFGVLELLGTAWEWCADRWAPYEPGRQVDPRGPRAGGARVVRGGSWASRGTTLRPWVRVALDPGTRSLDVGLRLACEVPGPDAGSTRLVAPGLNPLAQSVAIALPALKVKVKGKGLVEDLHGDRLPEGVRVRLGTERLQHARAVTGVVFSPTGAQVFTTSEDGTLRAWSARDGREAGRFCELNHPLTCLDVDSRARTLVTGGADMAVRLWKARTKRELLCIRGFKAAVSSVRFDPEGTQVACASKDGVVRILDLRSRQRTYKFLVDASESLRVDWSQDGAVLLVGGGAGVVRRFDARMGKELEPLSLADSGGHVGTVLDLRVSADANRLVVSEELGGAGRLTFWDLQAGTILRAVARPAPASALAIPGNHTRVMAVAGEPGAQLVDGQGLKPLRSWAGQAARCVALSPEGDLVAAGLASGAVGLWRAAGGEPVFTADIHAGPVESLALAGERWVATVGGDDAAFVWHAASGKRAYRVEGKGGAPVRVAISPDERTLLVAEAGGQLQFFGLSGREPLAFHQAFEGDALAARFLDDGNGVVVATREGGLYRFLWRPVKRLETLVAPGQEVRAADLDLAAGRAALAQVKGPVVVVDLADGAEVSRLEGPGIPALSVALLEGSEQVAVGSRDEQVRLYSVYDRDITRTLDGFSGAVLALAASPRGDRLAAGAGGAVHVLPVGVKAPRRVLEGHAGAVRALAWSLDGRTLFSAAEDRTVLGWDAD